MSRRRFSLCALILLWPAIVWAAPLKVVATYSVLGDIVKNVGGDRIALSVLVGPDADTHTFEPTPKENVLLAKAEVVFENGLHFEHWLDKLYQASGCKAPRVVASDGVEPIELAASPIKEVDPHIWHDVANAMVMTEQVRDGLIAVDGANAEYYQQSAQKYLGRLAALDHWVIDTLKDIPDEHRKLVTSHDTFGYFARRYGFTVVGAAIESATTEAADPSAAQIAQLVDKIKAAGVNTVFTEAMRNPKLMGSVAREAHVQVAPQLYTDALGLQDSDADSYIKMMEHNVRILAEFLGDVS